MFNTEYEAKFINIDKNAIREKLRSSNATLVKPEFLQKRVSFNFPKGHEVEGGWIRVRDEKDKVTMSVKIINGSKITNQKEICLKIDSFNEAEKFLVVLGCERKSYIENKRELWKIEDVEITLDEWPFIEPFVEIEADSEEKVKKISKLLGFDYSQALFGSTDIITQKKYALSAQVINKISFIAFDSENPYLNIDNK